MDLAIDIPPNQQQNLPGEEQKMIPTPIHDDPAYKGSDKLKNKVAIITGGDSGIGKAVAIAFAKEGANVVISYLNEDQDALDTKERVKKHGGQSLLIKGDLSQSNTSQLIVNRTLERFDKLDILINHAGEQYQTDSLEDITDESLDKIFRVNVFSMFYLTRAALKFMTKGASIVNTVSVVAYKGNPNLLDYSSTKGANLSFTRA